MNTTVNFEHRTIEQSGRAFDRGLEHGNALADQIAELIEEICLSSWRDDSDIARRLSGEVAALERLGGAHQLAELTGIALGSGLPFEDIARLNLIMGADGVPGVESLEGMYRPACSAIALVDPDLGAVCGKNGDAELRQARWYWVQKVDARDDGLHRYLNVIWPGTLWTDSGINEYGLAMVQTSGPGMLDQGPGLAGCVLPRAVLERASDVDEAIAVLSEVPGSGFGLVFVLADAGGRTAIVEKVHDRAAVRERGADYGWAVNRFEADELKGVTVPMPLDGLEESNDVRCAAFAGLDQQPGTRSELIETLTTPPIHQAGLGGLHSVHTAVYTPNERSLLTVGTDPDEPFRRHDLNGRAV